MGISFFLTPEFKELHAKWTQKLLEEGFKDYEREKDGKSFLIDYHSTRFFERYTVEEIEEAELHYARLRDFYHHYMGFKNELHKEIWRLHAEGFSRRKIAQTLNSKKHVLSADSIQIIISTLRKIMQTQTWPSSEMRDNELRHQNIKKKPHNI